MGKFNPDRAFYGILGKYIMKIKIDEIKLKIKILEDKKTKAIISLDFGDFVVKGFRIQESQYENYKGDKLWLTTPSYQGGGRYHPMFFIPDKELWQELEMKIWEGYYKENDSYHKKKYGIDDKDLYS